MRTGWLVLVGAMAGGCGPASRPTTPPQNPAPTTQPAAEAESAAPDEAETPPAEAPFPDPVYKGKTPPRPPVLPRGYDAVPSDLVTADTETELIGLLRDEVTRAWHARPPKGFFWIEHPTSGQPWLKDTGFNSAYRFNWAHSYGRHWNYDAIVIEIARERATIKLPRNGAQRGAVMDAVSQLKMKVVERVPRKK